MRNILFTFSIMFLFFQSLCAQRGTSVSDKNASTSTFAMIQGNWSTVPCDTVTRRIWCFTDSVMFIHKICVEFPEYSFSSDYLYYISDNVPEKFDYSKLGSKVSGKYIIYKRKRNETSDDFGFYCIDSLTRSTLHLFRDRIKDAPFFEAVDLKLWKVYSRSTVYNPGDVNQFFQRKFKFVSYWTQTGTSTFLVKLLSSVAKVDLKDEIASPKEIEFFFSNLDLNELDNKENLVRLF